MGSCIIIIIIIIIIITIIIIIIIIIIVIVIVIIIPNWTDWSTIQGVITRVISKSDEHEAARSAVNKGFKPDKTAGY